MLWFIGLTILGTLLWLAMAFVAGWEKGVAQFGAVEFLLARPVDDWPHMSLGTLSEIDRLVGLILDGKVQHIALWRFLEARPAIRDEIIRHQALRPTRPIPRRLRAA